MTTRLHARLARRGACLASLVLALVAAGCGSGRHSIPQRTPPGGWTAVDAAGPRADARDGEIRDAGARDLPRESGARDAAPSRDAGLRDAGGRDTARVDAALDASRDRARDGGADAAPGDGAAADGSPMCGQLHVSCAPFACDVDAGRCKYFCASAADCAPGRPCVAGGLCGFREPAACSSSVECASGHCADGVCCDTACNGACHSCVLPGTIGTCAAVPPGVVDPHGVCLAGAVCGADAGCSPTTCATDGDCGALHVCNGGVCHSCAATCISNPDCDVRSVCVARNGCTWCAVPDGGETP
ncbi:MAG TPA: hypothetical protein VKZ18_01515 [Polyangia bacterium]|nr:hypothetical protein [Polyangia bacterium]